MRTRRAGTTLGDELKCAILLRCLSGALKTHLSLSLKETSTYNELRKIFLGGIELIKRVQFGVYIRRYTRPEAHGGGQDLRQGQAP